MSYPRRVLKGYKVCIHTCVPQRCPNSKKSILWAREGGNLRRHAVSKKMHPDCNGECPGNGILMGTGPEYGRDPTAAELNDENDREDDSMDVDDTIRFTQPSQPSTSRSGGHRNNTPSTTTSTIDLNNEDVDFDDTAIPDTSVPMSRTFRLIYVPDPTRALTQERAKNDLAFLKTTLTEDEWNKVKHLTNSVHLLQWKGDIGDNNKSCTVLMQEWVSQYFCHHLHILILFMKQLCVMIRLQRLQDTYTGELLFEVAFLSWETFYEALYKPNSHSNVWAMFRHAHCLIGGIDMSIPYL